LEDVVVPVERLADTCLELSRLFDEYHYRDSVIFGHAKDGNIHFMLTDRFENDEQLGRYTGFTEAMVELVLSNEGSLKAEHGTGRVMAPYVRRQYGDELYDVMWRIKRLFDPRGLLNAGVVLSEDDEVHLRNIKLPPTIDEAIDRCVECGYCEPVCPSRDLTLTPRQRIAMQREIRAAELAGDAETAAALTKEYTYQGVHTCAVDGMCVTACPVLINTGLFIKQLRREIVPAPVAATWTAASRHWKGTTTIARHALNVTDALPGPLRPVLTGVNDAARAVIGKDSIPNWSPELPGGGERRARPLPSGEVTAVYLPACVNVMFGPLEGQGVQVGFEKLCASAGIRLLVPEGVEAICCGTPWSSKGIPKGYAAMRERVLPLVREATGGGKLPVVCDASSCTEGFAHMFETDPDLDVEIMDAVAFVARYVLPTLGDYIKLESLTIHPTCSSTQMGLNPELLTVAKAVAETVNVPLDVGCCAFAGDRGMLHPELTASATRREAAEVARLDAQAHASCNRTCELGMTRATGRPYRHVLELLAEQAGVV
jgi:D-lactate dehydrogenase